MMRFFKLKPKWQNTSPAVRQQAIQDLDAQDPVLHQLAQEDQDADVRRRALEKINDLALLRQRASNDPADAVRAYANTRLYALLSGQASDAPPLQQRLQILEPSASSAELLQRLAREGAETELRFAALQGLNDEALYAERAVQDPSAQLRLDALQQVQTLELLERIAREARNRDKRISRTARARVQAAQAEQQKQQQIQQLCEDMERLSWDGETGPNAARFAKLEDAWRKLEADIPTDLQQRFQQAHDAFAGHFKQSAATRSTRQELLQRAQVRLDELRQLQQLDPDDAELNVFLQDLKTAWDATGAMDDSESRRLQREFEQVCAQIQQRRQTLGQSFQQSKRMRLALADAERLTQRSGQVLESDLAELEQRWQHLPQLESKALQAELNQQFERAMAQLRARLRRQSELKEQEQDILQNSLDDLEQALDEGELQRAIDLQKHIRELLNNNISLSRRQMDKFEQRLQGAAGVIGRLNGWRRWGTNQAREHLIEEVEQLSQQGFDPAELARQVQAARLAWKEMDSGGSAPRALWKRFDTACERTYEPCRAYFQQQAQQRQQNLAQRQELCDELQKWRTQVELTQNDSGESFDWRELSANLQKIQQRWRQMGPVNRAERKAIEQRYHDASEALQAQLQPHLDSELKRRSDLIEQARQLAESSDIQTAINEVKLLQAEWKPRVLAPRRREQRLWKEFRAACDAVFERRQAEQKAQQTERMENLAQREGVIAAIKALSTLDGSALTEAEPKFAQLRAQWEAIGSVPRNAQTDSDRSYKNACREFEQALQCQHTAQQLAHLQALEQRAQICQHLESILDATASEWPSLLEAAHSKWQRLAPLKADVAARINARFEQVYEALQADSDEPRQALREALRQQQLQRRQLCLRMEIAAQVETPSEFAQERMEHQVARLSKSLAERSGKSESADAATIATEWFLTGALGDELDKTLERRFNKAYQKLFGNSTGT